MFHSLLIANRGEIACRIMKTAQRMGLRCIAVFSEADQGAQHVVNADEARLIGPSAAAESYLAIDKIIDAARQSGAEAVHPGYGFLSENADFAQACTEADLTFVGPTPEAIRAMGLKSQAKTLMEAAGVPLLPGYHGDDQDVACFEDAAQKIGYPLLVKASAGGGGKGMRRVDRASDLFDALESARREAASAFGDDRLLLERCLVHPRHIEVQVFRDTHGNRVHLFERDCSLQRRHQKVIEEAPAPGISEDQRQAMGQAALKAAEAIDYHGAGTVEFIAEDDSYYFMEMNTRLQVEHPVTEMITGRDLVEWQLRIAAGEKLPCGQEDLRINGHAFEARLYAEDPERDFLPASGRLDHFVVPSSSSNRRIDSGFVSGDVISIQYDPLIAKIVTWGRNRTDALRQMRSALADVELVGPPTNLDFLARLAAHPDFAVGGVDTAFIEDRREALRPKEQALPEEVLALACLAEGLRLEQNQREATIARPDLYSPWRDRRGWRLNGPGQIPMTFWWEGTAHHITLLSDRQGRHLLRSGGSQLEVDGQLSSAGALEARIGGTVSHARALWVASDLVLIGDFGQFRLALRDPVHGKAAAAGDQDRLASPMPGKIIAVTVEAGQAVVKGDALMVVEAMKMEHSIRTSRDGVVAQVYFAEGDLVEEGVELLRLAATGERPTAAKSKP
ncbi:MAG: acetyl/propionyl/methylcrotonyl-CoA carboxylase subunit alpha [Pseudomonadota bacterium]